MTVKFCVVVICYDYAEYVAAAIDSVLAQTYQNLEIIVIDAGSSDGSAEIIAGYGDRVRAFRQEIKGSIASYNRGFAESTGDIIVFMDADDVLDRHLAERVAGVWEPACAKVQYNLEIVDAGGSSTGRSLCAFPPDYDATAIAADFSQYATYTWPVGSGNAYSRWFLQRMLPLTVVHGPDGVLNTVAPVYGKVVNIRQALGVYRRHGQRLSGSKVPNWPERIDHRVNEMAILQDHARYNSVALPPGDLLDYDVLFTNFRLIALKLGQPYKGIAGDSALRLWGAGVKILLRRPTALRQKIVYLAWLSILSITPRWASPRLISFRYK